MSRRRLSVAGGMRCVPVDDLVDLAHQSVTLGVKEMCCRIGIDSGSFKRAASSLERVGRLKISDELLRQIVESEGTQAVLWQEQEQLELDFEAGKCLTTCTADQSPVSRVYVGLDGFMLPMVTQQEAGKRYEKARERRKKLPRKRGQRRRRLVKRSGTDQRYKEYKLVNFYDQEMERRLLRVTRHGPERAGRMLRQMADDVRLFKARQIVAVTDGAPWIQGVISGCLPAEKTTAILDFYHAAEHVHQARRAVYGESSEAGTAWAGRIIQGMLEGNFDDWWQMIVETRARVRAVSKRKALDGLMEYLLIRKEKIAYGRFRAQGFKIGSGPTESGCKSEARRLKGVGMRWTAENAQSMLALESLHQSNLWKTYWNSKLKAAA